jgi:hypothetical protein
MAVTDRRRSLLRAAAAMALAQAAPGLARPAAAGVRDVYGPRFDASRRQTQRSRIRTARARAMDSLREWHEIALEATGIDHAPVAPGEARVFGEQLGPCRSSRAMAIVHVAMFEAVNAIVRRWRGLADPGRVPRGASMDAAIAQAAHDALVALFPSQAADFDEALAQDVAQVRDTRARAGGVDLGRRAAAAMLALRAGDGSDHPEPRLGVDFVPQAGPGWWDQDPVSRSPMAMGAQWARVRPFVLQSADRFRVPAPPALDSAEYAAAFDEVRRLGGDGVTTPTSRSEVQARIGVYWAYDGMPTLCAPPRLYNQIALLVAGQQRTPVAELARLLALVNVAMADAGLAIWESKYHYQFWRPVTGIRAASGARLVADPAFTPLGAPASNLAGPNFTPPFPAYPSGHAGFGAALFEVLRGFYGTDRIPFTFVSDEFNGVTEDSAGNVRPRVARSFRTLSEAEEENGQSRIYLGIHWAFDKTEGIAQGRRVARYVMDHALRPA